MKIEGQHLIPAPREKVWAALNDPDFVLEGPEVPTAVGYSFSVRLWPWTPNLQRPIRTWEV